MGITKLVVDYLKCERCGFQWQPRKPVSRVRICPHCKSAYWDTPKERTETKGD